VIRRKIFGLTKESGQVESDLLHTEKILADRKVFFLDLKENARGKVVKITEDVSGNRDTIMVPAEILADFIGALQDIQATSEGDSDEEPDSE
tara:strand:- start:4669 stop:4944 length:276 start_codon:yes stop_codon:yes gene_type:complete